MSGHRGSVTIDDVARHVGVARTDVRTIQVRDDELDRVSRVRLVEEIRVELELVVDLPVEELLVFVQQVRVGQVFVVGRVTLSGVTLQALGMRSGFRSHSGVIVLHIDRE